MSNSAASIQAVNQQVEVPEQASKQSAAQAASQAANPEDKVTISSQAKEALANSAKSAAAS